MVDTMEHKAKKEVQAGDDAEDMESSSEDFDDSGSDVSSDYDSEEQQSGGEGNEKSESEEEDETIKAIKKANAGEAADHPPCIEVDDGSSSISFHPEQELISIGTLAGNIEVYHYSNESNEKIRTIKHTDGVCREASFSYDGSKLIGAFGNYDLCIYDTETGQLIHSIPNATDDLVMSVHSVDENVTFTGDDDGYVKLWDARQKFKAMSFKVSEDGISSLVCDDGKKVLVCSCLEGFIASIKIRGGKIDIKSEVFEKTEFTCLGLYKQNSKLVVGGTDGNMYVYNWDEFGYPNDIYATGKHGINAMVAITDRISIIGGDEGPMKAKHLFPYKSIGVVCDHTVSVDSMDVCNDGHLVASLSNVDSCVNFLNVSYFQGYSLPVEPKSSNPKPKSEHQLPSSKQKNPGEFFKGMLD